MIRTIALRGLAIAISIVLLAWLVVDARWQGVGARLARIDGRALIGVASLFAASYAMRGARIHGEFSDEVAGRRVYLRILRLTLVHNALVNVLPFRSGEFAFPLLLSRWFGVTTGRAVVSLLWLRTQDAIVVLALAILVWPGLAVGWRTLLLIAVVGGAISVPAWARRHRVDPSSSTRTGRLRALLARSTQRNRVGWFWTVGNWTVKLTAEAWLVALALQPDVDASAATAALGALGAELAAILPVQGVAGFGTFEAGGAAMMRTQGIDLSTGLEAVLAVHAVVLALATTAGVLAAVLLPGPPSTPPSAPGAPGT